MRELRKQDFFFTNWNREFKTLILLSWFLLCLLSVDFCGSSKVMGQQEDVVAGPKKTAALTYLELCKDAKMRGGSRGEWESNMGLLSSSSYTIKDDSKTTNDNQDGKSLTSWVRKNRLLKNFFFAFFCVGRILSGCVSCAWGRSPPGSNLKNLLLSK